MSELKPCPFCGSSNFKMRGIGLSVWIACGDCGSQGKSDVVGKMAAVKAWNVRTESARIKELSDTIDDLLQAGKEKQDALDAEKCAREDFQDKVKELEQSLADAMTQINQLMGGYDE